MPTTRTASNSDRKTVLWLAAATLLATILFAALGPDQEDNDPEPTTYNAGTRGAKAAFILLPRLGYTTRRWEQPTADLASPESKIDAPNTTLILTSPMLPVEGLKPLQQQLKAFLERGGTILATGPNGAKLLPGGVTNSPTRILSSLCSTAPEGPTPLARIGHVSTDVPVRWDNPDPQFQVAQRCSNDAVVVTYSVGPGRVIWWASPRPLTNAGLDDDPNLTLLLASIGAPGRPETRTVLFDEYLHQQRESLANTLHGLPWWSLGLQLALLLILLIFSKSRRSGPLRAPVVYPRTSPLEFAESMGRLYARAQATPAATEAARARLHETLRSHCALPRETIAAGPAEIAHALTLRFGGDWSTLELHLQQAQQASAGTIAPASALKLVQSLEADNQLLLATVTRSAVVEEQSTV